MEDSERLAQGQILARVIIEMLGAPKNHIESTMKDYLKKLREDHTMLIQAEQIEPAEAQGKLYSTFAELEIWFKNISKLLEFCIDSMPSSVEILEPERMIMQSAILSGVINDLQAKIHKVDMSLKGLIAENEIYLKNNQALLKNIVVLCIKTNNDTLSKIEGHTGIAAKQLEVILGDLIKRGSIKKKGEKYTC